MGNDDDHIDDELLKSILDNICSDEDSPEAFAEKKFGLKLYENQRDILRALTDSDIRKVQVLELRQSGKTSSVAAAIAYEMERHECSPGKGRSKEPFRVGIFAPVLDQSLIDLTRLRSFCERSPEAKGLIDFRRSTTEKIVWHTGAECYALSGSEQAHLEGHTFDYIIIEEGQFFSDYILMERILPMLGATGGKIAKIGTPRGVRNNFWRSWFEKQLGYTTISHSVFYCGNLYVAGAVELEFNGSKVLYPRVLLDLMPLSFKQKRFPANPEVWFEGEMDEDSFASQYELSWNETSGLFLTNNERDSMIGTHELQSIQNVNDMVFAGIDFNASNGNGRDETAIAVWRKTKNNVLEKIFGETITGELMSQMDRIIDLFNKRNGPFRPTRILVDATGAGAPSASFLRSQGIDVIEINFGATDEHEAKKDRRMNYKTSMFMYFKFELDNGRIKYAKKQNHPDRKLNGDYHKGLAEWWGVEVEDTNSHNKIIGHASNGRDDIPCSDVLAVFGTRTDRTFTKTIDLNNIRVAFAYPGRR